MLCGCGSLKPTQVGSPTDYGAYPSNYVEIVHSWIKYNFKDPDSVKDLDIKEPMKHDWKLDYGIWGTGHTYGYNIYFWCNAKNSYGGYTGLQNSFLFVRDGAVLHSGNISDGTIQ